jgi:hypothetical protein
MKRHLRNNSLRKWYNSPRGAGGYFGGGYDLRLKICEIVVLLLPDYEIVDLPKLSV